MSATIINGPASGESMIGIEPQLAQQVDPGWRHRLSLYTGRALSDTALATEQQYRSGLLAVLSQNVTYGICAGLEVTLDVTTGNLRVSAGFGFSSLGEDVTLTRDLTTVLDQVPVVDAITSAPISGFSDLRKNTKGGTFVLMLQPVKAEATGEEINTGSAAIEVSGDLSASCSRDPEEYAFEDWEIVDGTRVVLAQWPDQPDSLKLPAVAPANTFRNRLAYTIFNAELQLDADQYLPWQAIGVALAVLNFDTAWNLLFVDRNSVVRSGGRALKTQLVIPDITKPGQFLRIYQSTAEARLLQLLEQNAQISSQADFTAYLSLPPTGILPAGALDLVNRKNAWFPKNWGLQVAPIHAEEVETVLRSQMLAAPLDLTQAENIQIFIPLSDDAYDPNVLMVEALAQEFKDELTNATNDRNGVLQHRKFVQVEANVLLPINAEPVLDLDAGLTDDEKAGRDAVAYKPAPGTDESYGTTADANGKLVSKDVQSLKTAAAASPYTVQVPDPKDPKTSISVPLISADDWTDLDKNGLQHFIDRITGRVNTVDDLINLTFLQTQTDIYRYRTNVLNATDAARLVTSPIIANIAQRESAVATAQDLKAYIDSIQPQPAPPGAPPAPPPARAVATGAGVKIPLSLNLAKTINTANLVSLATSPAGAAAARAAAGTGALSALGRGVSIDGGTALLKKSTSPVFIGQLPSQTQVPQEPDVTSQLPIQGVPFNLRTLSIAERLKTSPSHEALLYSIANRTTVLDQLLAADFGITVDDLEVLVQEQDAKDNTKFNLTSYTLRQLQDATTRAKVYASIQQAGLPANSDEPSVFSAGITVLDHHTLLLRAVEARVALYRQFLQLCTSALTAVQGHIGDLETALKKLDNDLTQARQNLAFVNAIITDENNRIAAVNAKRQKILNRVPYIAYARPRTLDPIKEASTTETIAQADGTSAVFTATLSFVPINASTVSVTAGTQVLTDDGKGNLTGGGANSTVDYISGAINAVFSKAPAKSAPVTAQYESQGDVPSRQLVPANVASPVPAALQANVTIPPELRELAGLLREVPLSWFPASDGFISKLEFPQHFIDVALSTQVRAFTRLQLPPRQSSAPSQPGPYAQPIADIFASQQQAVTAFVQQRANYPVSSLVSLSWSAQKTEILNLAAMNDVIASEAAHLEVTNDIVQIIQNVSKVATALYLRVSGTLPADRLRWADYLSAAGRSIRLQSLAVLPGWNSQDYVDRQQMQLIVDWLFAQIDAGVDPAASFMSDMVRTAILLASHAPVGDIIAGEVAERALPNVGGIIKLTTPSTRVGRGMPVLLYQSGVLTAKAVVDDLDTQQIHAKVTSVYQPNTYLETSAQVHFTNQDPQDAVLMKAPSTFV